MLVALVLVPLVLLAVLGAFTLSVAFTNGLAQAEALRRQQLAAERWRQMRIAAQSEESWAQYVKEHPDHAQL